MQSETDVQAIAVRSLAFPGLGMAIDCQVAPFHDSARAMVAPMSYPPTAMHSETRGQETAARSLTGPPGLGAVWYRQVRPFHDSPRSTSASDPLIEEPTATHAAGRRHEIPERPVDLSPGLGVRRMRQCPPSHCSARVSAEMSEPR